MKCNLSIAIRYQVSFGGCSLFKPSFRDLFFFFGRSTTPFASDYRVGERYTWPWPIRKPTRHSRAVDRGPPPCLLPDVHPRTRPHSTTYQTGRSREVLCRRRRTSFCWINYMQVFSFYPFYKPKSANEPPKPVRWPSTRKCDRLKTIYSSRFLTSIIWSCDNIEILEGGRPPDKENIRQPLTCLEDRKQRGQSIVAAYLGFKKTVWKLTITIRLHTAESAHPTSIRSP